MSDGSQWPVFSEPGGAGVSSQRRAWRALYKTYWALVPAMDRDLRERADVDLQTYTALVHTYEAGPAGIRMKDLATNATLSTSGLTSLVDRLVKRGLLERKPDPDDRRATRIILTEHGLEQAREAAHVHILSIEEQFAARLTEAEATIIGDILERIEAEASSQLRPE